MTSKKALIMVDLQNDFCPGGALAVSGGNEIIVPANRLQAQFDVVIATKDWHPPNHVSFASQHEHCAVGDVISVNGIMQVLWPDHCIQQTQGAAFHPALCTNKISKIIYKGSDPALDSYSAFFDNARLRKTGLESWLRESGIDTVYIIGLATDYCVKYTALDAVSLHFNTYLIENVCRGVELQAGDCARAIDEMQRAGVHIISEAIE